MRHLRVLLPILLTSGSLIGRIRSNRQQILPSYLFNLVGKQSVCKMSTNVREEVNRQKEFYDSLSLEEKRKMYACGNKYVQLNSIPTWKKSEISEHNSQQSSSYEINSVLNDKISLFRGDITTLEIDAIVNAANSRLAGGGGVDGAIHRAAGQVLLLNECSLAGGLPTGNSLLTSGYKLPSKRIIHTVGPMGEKPDDLRNCYENSLNLAKNNNLRSIAFPCISTGVYGYPSEKAAHVALKTVRDWLQANPDSIDRVIFCLFMPIDIDVYNQLLPFYFPK